MDRGTPRYWHRSECWKNSHFPVISVESEMRVMTALTIRCALLSGRTCPGRTLSHTLRRSANAAERRSLKVCLSTRWPPSMSVAVLKNAGEFCRTPHRPFNVSDACAVADGMHVQPCLF